jgi:hypothetical protein
MKPISIAILAAAALSLVAEGVALSQPLGGEYVVKFVCGRRAAPPAMVAWDAVAPGSYFTAVNIRNASLDTARVRVEIATTRPAPSPGLLVPLSPGLLVPPRRAIELDCREILTTAPVVFLKGFVVLTTNRDLDVTAVYSAAEAGVLRTMDVETVQPRRAETSSGASCPDLTVVALSNPAITANLHTRIRVTVRNIGTANATAVTVRIEDQSGATADRIVEATIALLAAGNQVDVVLDLPYQLAPSSWPSVLAVVDPKNEIAECNEGNNQRRVTD